MGAETRETGDSRPKLSTRQRDRLLAEFAANRHRVSSLAELRRLGLSVDQVKRRVEDGRLVRRYRGIFAVGPGPLTDHGEWLAAALFAAPDGVVSHRDAARLSCLQDGGAAGVIHITCPRRISAPSGIRAHRSPLAPDERTILHGVPTSTTGRTLLDCAAVGAPVRELERMLSEAHVLGLPIRPSLPELIVRHSGHRGLVALRSAHAGFTGGSTRTKSDLEEDFLAFLDRRGFPRPHINHRIETLIGVLAVSYTHLTLPTNREV